MDRRGRRWLVTMLAAAPAAQVPVTSAAQSPRAPCCADAPSAVAARLRWAHADAAPVVHPYLTTVAPDPDSLIVVRPMSRAERGVVTLSAALSGTMWGLGGAGAGGLVGVGACLGRSEEDALDRVRGCRAAERWLVAGGMLGTLAGAATGARFAASRLGCGKAESGRRAWRGAALGSALGALPAVAYAVAEDPSLLVGAAVVLTVPVLQIAGAARDAGRCRLPVPILRSSAAGTPPLLPLPLGGGSGGGVGRNPAAPVLP